MANNRVDSEHLAMAIILGILHNRRWRWHIFTRRRQQEDTQHLAILVKLNFQLYVMLTTGKSSNIFKCLSLLVFWQVYIGRGLVKLNIWTGTRWWCSFHPKTFPTAWQKFTWLSLCCLLLVMKHFLWKWTCCVPIQEDIYLPSNIKCTYCLM